MSHERFKFDDEIDDLEELQPIKTENKAVNDIDKSLADSGDKDSGDKSMGKGKKKKITYESGTTTNRSRRSNEENWRKCK